MQREYAKNVCMQLVKIKWTRPKKSGTDDEEGYHLALSLVIRSVASGNTKQ